MEITMKTLVKILSLVCSVFATKYKPDLSEDDLEYISHKVNCALFEATAEVSGVDVEELFQSLKFCLLVEDDPEEESEDD